MLYRNQQQMCTYQYYNNIIGGKNINQQSFDDLQRKLNIAVYHRNIACLSRYINK